MNAIRLSALFAATGGFLLAGCSGGIEFNGVNNSTQIQPRTQPITHFPMPIEMYDPAEDEYQLERATLLFGRQVASPHSGQPTFAEPITPAFPTNPTVFIFKPGTDIWEITSRLNQNPPPPTGFDINDIYAGSANQYFAGSMSVVCQWMMQRVDGSLRSDAPFNYGNIEVESLPITLYNAGGIGTNAQSGTGTRLQNPIDVKIGVKGTADPTKTVLTQNTNADRTAVTVPGRSNQLELVSPATSPGALKFGAWREAPQENLFIEGDERVLVDAPSSGYFNAVKKVTVDGGAYLGRLVAPLNPVYDPNIDIGWYQLGVTVGHVIGLGVGLPETAFVRPGQVSEEEDIMNIAVQTDGVFFQSAGRRFQYTPEHLIIMRNTGTMPLGSAKRSDAELLSITDPFDRLGVRMRETLPGPKR